jgi:hypothetical protein
MIFYIFWINKNIEMFTDNEGQLYNPINKLRDLILHSHNTISALENLAKDNSSDNFSSVDKKLQFAIDSIENLKKSASILDNLQFISDSVRILKDNLVPVLSAYENANKDETATQQKEIIDLTADEPETIGENEDGADVKEIELIEEQPKPVSYVTYRRKNQVVEILLQYMKEDRLLRFDYKGKQKKGFVLDIWNTKNSSKLVASVLHFDDETNAKYWRTYCVAFIKPIIRGPRCFGCVSNQKDRRAHCGEDGCLSE